MSKPFCTFQNLLINLAFCRSPPIFETTKNMQQNPFQEVVSTMQKLILFLEDKNSGFSQAKLFACSSERDVWDYFTSFFKRLDLLKHQCNVDEIRSGWTVFVHDLQCLSITPYINAMRSTEGFMFDFCQKIEFLQSKQMYLFRCSKMDLESVLSPKNLGIFGRYFFSLKFLQLQPANDMSRFIRIAAGTIDDKVPPLRVFEDMFGAMIDETVSKLTARFMFTHFLS